MSPELKYGLVAGTGICLWILLEQLLGFHAARAALGEYSGYFSGVIQFAVLFLLLKARATAPGARLSLGQGVNSGLYSSFVAALLVYCALVAYSQFVNPGWLDQTLEWKVARMRSESLPETYIRQQIVTYRNAHSPLGLIATRLAGMTLLGAAFSLGLTLWLRRANVPRPPA